MKNKKFSIINWELHQKLQKKTKIEKEYKYPKKKKPGCFKRIINHIKEVGKELIELLKSGHAPRR
jgi:basic membrane lipoprotein Med (substrate-binding protein (PBP1-ABC) superfamily)